METEKRGNLVINGFGASNGGQFCYVTINGKGTVNTDLECTAFECNGSGTVHGDLLANTAKINGMAKLKGNVEAQKLAVDGTTKIDKNLKVQKLKVSGNATIGGSVKAEEVLVEGRLEIEGDCEAETFTAKSQFKIGGLLNAEVINVEMDAASTAKEIGGQTVIVKQRTALFGLFKPILETELIEGDKIEIENTKATIVRGNHVIIGANSNIGLVEYTGDILIDKKAVVGESRKV